MTFSDKEVTEDMILFLLDEVVNGYPATVVLVNPTVPYVSL